MASLIDPNTHKMEIDLALPNDKRNKVAQQFMIGTGATVKGSLAEEYMKARAFERSSCDGMDENDVHPEIIEWIVDAALNFKPSAEDKAKKSAVMGEIKKLGPLVPLEGGAWKDTRDPAQELPDFDGSVFKNVLYFTADGSKKSYCPTSKDFFRKLYSEILVQGKSSDLKDLKSGPSDRKEFSLDVDRFVRHRMFQITSAPIVHGEPDCDDADGSFEMIDMLQAGAENVVVRDPATKKLMRRGKDGKYVAVGEEDEITKDQLRAAHKCYGTGYQDDKNCKNFMFECLLSQDAGALQACLSKWANDSANNGKSLFELQQEDIKNLHPVLALRILQQFGFRKYRVFDEVAGGQLYKVESVKHWLHNFMATKFDQAEVQKMFHDGKTNTILKYLDLVSQFVNANPAILNKDYSGSSAEAVGKQPVSEYARKLGLNQYIPVTSRSAVSYDFNRLRGYLQAKPMRAPFQLSASNVSFPFGSMMTPGAGVGLLQGGGSKCDYVIKAFTQAGNTTGAQLMEHYLNSIILDLQKKGKTLATKDSDNLKAQLKKLAETETSLIRTLCFIDEYNRLLATLGDYSSKTVTLNEINSCKFAERYNLLDGKYHSTENLLLEVIAKIQNLGGAGDSRKFEPLNLEN